MFDQINKYKASFGRLFEAKTLKVMLEIALLTILLSFLGPIKNMIYTEVVNKLSLGITVKLGDNHVCIIYSCPSDRRVCFLLSDLSQYGFATQTRTECLA